MNDNARIKTEMHKLEKLLKYDFQNISWLEEAMKSQKLEKLPENGKNQRDYSNETLSFLGDTIIKFLIAEYLYGDGKNKRKGSLSTEKESLENNATLHKIMIEEELIPYSYHDAYFHMDDPPVHQKVVTKKHDPYIEAIAAAIYKDGGWDAVSDWFQNWLLPLLKKHRAMKK